MTPIPALALVALTFLLPFAQGGGESPPDGSSPVDDAAQTIAGIGDDRPGPARCIVIETDKTPPHVVHDDCDRRPPVRPAVRLLLP